MPNPYLLLGLGIAWLVSLAGVGYWQHGAGVDSERVEWQRRELKQVTTAANRIRQLHEAARKAEQKAAADLAAVAAQYEKEKAHEVTKRDRVIADLRTGGLRLRIPVATPLYPDRSRAGPATPTTGERDGRTVAELSGPAAEFLVGLASEADEVAHQLTACQAIVRRDRETGK